MQIITVVSVSPVSISVYNMTVGTFVSQTKGNNFLRIAMYFYRKMMQLF